jgi:hypothetical protein
VPPTCDTAAHVSREVVAETAAVLVPWLAPDAAQVSLDVDAVTSHETLTVTVAAHVSREVDALTVASAAPW